MKKTRTLVLAIGLLLLIVVAYVAYNKLSDSYEQKKKEEQLKEDELKENGKEDAVDQGNESLDGQGTEDTEKELEKAIDFTATDINGNEVKLSDFYGKPIVLNFWASWCGPCQYEMPHFQTLYDELGEEVQFIMLNLADGYQETVEKASEFIESNQYTFPVYYDTNLDAAFKYAVYSIPVTYFINSDGEIVETHRGIFEKEEDLREEIDNLMK